MQRYDVSRITASKAVSILAEEGLIYRARKLGTFVKDLFLNQIIPINTILYLIIQITALKTKKKF